MTAVARGNGTDIVQSLTGTLSDPEANIYGNPFVTMTNTCSNDVRANGIGVVRIGDLVEPHLNISGAPDVSTLAKANAKNVYANGKLVAEIGSQYTADNTITSGSPDVTIG